jgi:hypothetical protein
MQTTLIIIAIVAIQFFVVQLYTYMATEKSETQEYKVIKVEKEFEIRFYPAVTMAMVNSSTRSYKELGNSGFTQLAGYIFGGNADKTKIAMTSPVHMNVGGTISSMAFVMPSKYTTENLPLPNNERVKLTTVPQEYVAAMRFGGFATNEVIKQQTEYFERLLRNHHLSYYGNFRLLGYNPPFQLFGRRNEIIVALHWNGNNDSSTDIDKN